MPPISEIISVINSGGGNVNAGVSMYNFLSTLSVSRKVKLHTFNIGIVASSASLLFLAGTRRSVCSNALFEFHGVSTGDLSRLNAISAKVTIQSIEHDNSVFRGIYENKTKMKKGEIDKIFQTDVIMDAQDSIKSGIADEIVEFQLPSGRFVLSDLDNTWWP